MRPGFERKDTDGISLEPVKASSSTRMDDDSERRNEEPKEGQFVDVNPIDPAIPAYDVENDGFGRISQPVETAKDLVTQVLHVDDDPTLNPLTFRVFFLGMYCHRFSLLDSSRKLFEAYTHDTRQVLAYVSSEPCSRKSSISSHRPSMSL